MDIVETCRLRNPSSLAERREALDPRGHPEREHQEPHHAADGDRLGLGMVAPPRDVARERVDLVDADHDHEHEEEDQAEGRWS
jgi:hypothetical protein